MTDSSLLDRLIRRLDVQAWGDDRYRGGSGVGGVTAADRLFGGLVVAQATVAALRHVAVTSREFALHSLHSYFLRPGRAEQDIELRVQTTKAGRRFQARRPTSAPTNLQRQKRAWKLLYRRHCLSLMLYLQFLRHQKIISSLKWPV